MAEISGRVELRTDKRRGKMTIIVRSESGMEREHHVPHDRHLLVHTGDFVEAGEPLTEGPLVPHDILDIRGEEALQNYMLAEVQGVYRSQGVTINDKHIEVIVRQMLQKVEIVSGGETDMFPGEQIDQMEYEAANAKAIDEGKTPAEGVPILLGITKASLQTRSFFSAASFQETTRVLTEAAVNGKVDPLEGLKENIIVGRLIPAGTGGTINRIRRVATHRDELILEERQKLAEAAQPDFPEVPAE